jgi:molybdopterin-guanine dinucleotide biosynthesis protein A
VVADVRPGFGSLGGIYTAVVEAPAPVVCVAWDMPFVAPELVRALAAGLDGYDAFLPESGGRRGVEPLCAAYGPACAPAIAASLDAGDFRAIGFHGAVRAGRFPLDEVRRLGDPERLFFNVNTADDLARAETLWRHASSRS